MAVALDQPHRRDLDKPDDRRAEHVVGRLRMYRLLTAAQYDALEAWTKLVRANRRLSGLPPPSYPSLFARHLPWDGAPAAEDPDKAIRVAEDYERASRAIYGAFGWEGFDMPALLTGVCEMHRVPNAVELEWVKRAADVLAGLFGIDQDTARHAGNP